MDTQTTDEEVEADGGEGVVLQEAEDESDPDEDHHMHIVEQGAHCIPSCLKQKTKG